MSIFILKHIPLLIPPGDSHNDTHLLEIFDSPGVHHIGR